VLASTALDLAGCEPPIPQLPEAVVDEILLYVPNCLSTCAPVCKVWAAAAVRATTRRKQEQETLLAALASPMGFHKGKPLAALVVFRACLLWRVFQADRTKVFDGIAQVRAGWVWVVMVSMTVMEGGLCKGACSLACTSEAHPKQHHQGKEGRANTAQHIVKVGGQASFSAL
jgi:hypothetical protein